MKWLKSIAFILIILLPLLAAGQDPALIVQQYKAKLATIQTIACEVEQLDTFVTGHVWHYTGQALLQRNTDDPLFGFNYKSSKPVGGEAFYDGNAEFQIDHEKKEYEMNANPRTYILGSPGGQLIVEELMYYKDDTIVPTVAETPTHYILQYAYPDLTQFDVTERIKEIYLDKATFLPAKVVKRQLSLGKKQVISRSLRKLVLNAPKHASAFDNLFLNTYQPILEEDNEDLHKDLLQTMVKDFSVEDFDGTTVSIQSKKGKVVLIDFWEVWCGPCRSSMPQVQAMHEKYQDQGLEVMGVLLDKKSVDSAQLFLDKKGFSFAQNIGGQELKDYFRILAIPQYVLIDRKGKIQQVYQGYHEEIEEEVKTLLAQVK